jgi:hypothetical protein
VACSCKYGDEPAGSGAMGLVSTEGKYKYSLRK